MAEELGKIAVMGAGAVGCYYGGMLARAGHPVVLIGRKAHVDAARARGLRVERKDFDASYAVEATESPEGVRGAGVVLFCVKSTDTESAGEAMKPFLGRDAVVLSLQNGVDNPERLSKVLGREVIPAVVYVATEMAGPAHVRHHGRGDLLVGNSKTSGLVKVEFEKAGIPVEVSDNAVGALWAKLVVNCAYNALSALANLPYGRLVAGEGIPEVQAAVVEECLAVARASGITIPGDQHAAVKRIGQSMPTQYSSTAQDLQRGKKTEIDHLNGVVVRKGEALGVQTPVNRALVSLVKFKEKEHDR